MFGAVKIILSCSIALLNLSNLIGSSAVMSLEEKDDLVEFMKVLQINFQWSIMDSNGKYLSSHQPYLQQENSISMDDDEFSEDGVSRTRSPSTSPSEILLSPVGHSSSLLDSPYSLNKIDDEDCIEDVGGRPQALFNSQPENVSSPNAMLHSPDSSNLSNVHDSPAVNDVSRSSSFDEVTGPRPSENRTESVNITSFGQAETVHHKFSSTIGLAANIELCSGNLTARRKRNPGHSLVFSAHCLDTEELFEVKIDEIDPLLSGGIKIGLVTFSSNLEYGKVPQDLKQLDSWWVESSMVLKKGVAIKHNYGPCLERLTVGDKLGVKKTQDGGMRIVINGEDVGLACTGVSASVRAVVGVTGCVTSVSVTSCHRVVTPQEESQPSPLPDSLYSILEKEGGGETSDVSGQVSLEFHDNRVRNVALCHGNTVPKRNDSYNQGIVMSAQPLVRDPVTRINKSLWYWYKPVTISSGENIKIKLGVANNEDHSQTDTSDTSDTNNNHQNDKDVKAYLIGFKNQGNTCYINASMQATIGLCFFVQRIISTFDGKRIVHLSIKFTKFSCSSGWSWELIILFCVPMQNSEEWKPSKC